MGMEPDRNTFTTDAGLIRGTEENADGDAIRAAFQHMVTQELLELDRIVDGGKALGISPRAPMEQVKRAHLQASRDLAFSGNQDAAANGITPAQQVSDALEFRDVTAARATFLEIHGWAEKQAIIRAAVGTWLEQRNLFAKEKPSLSEKNALKLWQQLAPQEKGPVAGKDAPLAAEYVRAMNIFGLSPTSFANASQGVSRHAVVIGEINAEIAAAATPELRTAAEEKLRYAEYLYHEIIPQFCQERDRSLRMKNLVDRAAAHLEMEDQVTAFRRADMRAHRRNRKLPVTADLAAMNDFSSAITAFQAKALHEAWKNLAISPDVPLADIERICKEYAVLLHPANKAKITKQQWRVNERALTTILTSLNTLRLPHAENVIAAAAKLRTPDECKIADAEAADRAKRWARTQAPAVQAQEARNVEPVNVASISVAPDVAEPPVGAKADPVADENIGRVIGKTPVQSSLMEKAFKAAAAVVFETSRLAYQVAGAIAQNIANLFPVAAMAQTVPAHAPAATDFAKLMYQLPWHENPSVRRAAFGGALLLSLFAANAVMTDAPATNAQADMAGLPAVAQALLSSTGGTQTPVVTTTAKATPAAAARQTTAPVAAPAQPVAQLETVKGGSFNVRGEDGHIIMVMSANMQLERTGVVQGNQEQILARGAHGWHTGWANSHYLAKYTAN